MMESKSYIEKQYDNITKSPNDQRLYRGLVLTNKLKVLLISDSTTDKSAASLDVNIGHMSDPDGLQGLAHFCEHMLFLGTSKYPIENDYNMYLSQNGGSSNAATSQDYTFYYFDVAPDKLEGALDRFSQFFITPLFTESATGLELNAVNSEHEKNLANDLWRLDQLERSSGISGHPYTKFGTGNKQTLDILPKQRGINVREQLLEFYNKYYSANIMSLCVLGKESLDELEIMVVNMFKDIANKNVEAPVWPVYPFSEEQFQTTWYVVPIKDVRNLTVIFKIPYMHKHYRYLTTGYFSHLLGHEGQGSLLSTLKAKGWCNSLISGQRKGARGFNFFSVLVDLTEDGIKNTNNIVKLIFQYINMLRKEGPTEWIYDEYRDIAKMNFKFKEKTPPTYCVQTLVRLMQEYPMEHILTVGQLFDEWNPELINTIMEYLTPKNIRVLIIGKAFENIANETEPWYKTKFKKEKLSDEVIKNWSDSSLHSDLHLPLKNIFIPQQFDIKPINENANKYPVIIEDTAFIRLWYKQDDEFLLPKANMTFDFVSPLVYLDPININMTNLFVALLRDSLNEYAYAADLAGLKWDVSYSRYGITLGIGGYNDKQSLLLEKIMDKMTNFVVDSNRFEALKENYIRNLKNFHSDHPYKQAMYYLSVVMSEQTFLKTELLDACIYLTLDRIQEFIPQLLAKFHVECLIHGNITMSEALEVAKLVEAKIKNFTKFQITPLLPRQLLLHREIKLEDGCHFLYEAENKLHISSCTEVYYQTGLQSTETNMLLELLTQILCEPCFNVLRTKEQLGYIVFCGTRKACGVQGLKVIIQSDRRPEYVEKRINLFMDTMLDGISAMSEEEFENHKESLASKLLERPKTLTSMSTIFWSEITSQEYNFDRVNIEVTYLKTITKQQIIKFFKDHIFDDKSPKLSVHVFSTAKAEMEIIKKEAIIEDDTEIKYLKSKPIKKIDDIIAFKVSQSLYPLVQPISDIPKKGIRSSKL